MRRSKSSVKDSVVVFAQMDATSNAKTSAGSVTGRIPMQSAY